jgi:hypothetical protein
MNAFERNLHEDWSALKGLLCLAQLDEFERRLSALIAAMELCEDRSWLVGDC